MSNFFEKPKSKIVPSTSIFAQVVDWTVLPSTINRWWGGRGGERKKPHLEVIIYVFEPWTKTMRHSNIIQKPAPTARQTPDASPPTSTDQWTPRPLKVWESVGQEALPSRGQNVTYLSQMGPSPAPHVPPPPPGWKVDHLQRPSLRHRSLSILMYVKLFWKTEIKDRALYLDLSKGWR
jgi:hypothetical protein